MMSRWRLHLILLLFLTTSACGSECINKTTPLYLVIMAPLPDSEPGLMPGWAGGPAVIPGALLAIKHINSNCDILEEYRLEAIIRDSGCNIASKARIGTLETLFYNNTNIIGIIGPGCSEATIAVGRILSRPQISLLNIAPSATSPELVDPTLYYNTFRPITSSLGFLQTYHNFIMRNNFTNVAVFFETERAFHTKTATVFVKQLQGRGIPAALFGMVETLIPLSQIKNIYPVVFVFGGGGIASKLMCLAYHRGMIYPNYQYIFSDRRVKHFLKDVEAEDDGILQKCSNLTMKEAIQGIILNLVRLTRKDDQTLVNGMNYTQFNEQYNEEFSGYVQENNYTMDDVVDTEHESGFYDSTWALALSLNASIPQLREEMNTSLRDYRYSCSGCTEIIRTELLKVTFEGIRGTVDFSNDTLDGEDVTVIDMFYVGDSREQVAVYDPSLPEGSKLNITNMSVFIDDEFVLEAISPPLFVEVIVLIVLAMATISTVFFHVVTMKWTGAKSVKATSPNLNHIIFSGCYLYVLSVLFLSLQLLPGAQDRVFFGVMCSGFIWCESIALTLIFATICVKMWRVFRIFSHASASVLVNLEDYRLILYICALLFVDVVFNVAWNAENPWYRHLVAQDQLRVRWICNCDNSLIWISCLLAQKALLTLVLLYLSILTRRIPKLEYRQTTSTNALIYSLIFLYSFTIPVYLILLNRTSIFPVTVSYLSLCFKNIMCIVLCTIFIFLPPVLPVLKTKLWTFVSKFRTSRPPS